jgi:hypothetical protein
MKLIRTLREQLENIQSIQADSSVKPVSFDEFIATKAKELKKLESVVKDKKWASKLLRLARSEFEDLLDSLSGVLEELEGEDKLNLEMFIGVLKKLRDSL